MGETSGPESSATFSLNLLPSVVSLGATAGPSGARVLGEESATRLQVPCMTDSPLDVVAPRNTWQSVGVGVTRHAHRVAQILRAQASQSAQNGSFEWKGCFRNFTPRSC